jgi:ribosomal-protein-serine acetyltransferase
MFPLKIDNELELSPVEPPDAEALFGRIDACRDSLRVWLPWVDQTKSVDNVKNFVSDAIEQHARNDGFQCVIRKDRQPVGVIGLHNIDWPHRATSIGYWLDCSHQGGGLMTRSCRALVDAIFKELELHRVMIPGRCRQCQKSRRPRASGVHA